LPEYNAKSGVKEEVAAALNLKIWYCTVVAVGFNIDALNKEPT